MKNKSHFLSSGCFLFVAVGWITFSLAQAAWPVLAQSEHLKTKDQIGVVVCRPDPALADYLDCSDSPKPVPLLEQLGGRPNFVHIVARHADGKVFANILTTNLRTTGGADWQASAMGNTSTPPATVNYIALTNNGSAPAVGDCAAGSSACTLTGEITTNGLARAQGTYAHSNGTNTWTLAFNWTATGTQSVQKAGMFNAVSSGTMVFEDQFTQVNLVATDTLSITWTVSI